MKALSRIENRRWRIAIFYLLSSILGLVLATVGGVACGKKGDPRAPELAVPETIRDLTARAESGAIAITWSQPTHYIDGKELRDLAAFVVFRRDVSESCPDCPAAYRERTTLSVEDQEKFMRKKRLRFVDDELKPQTIYRYRVFSQLRDGSLSGPSNEVEVTWRP